MANKVLNITYRGEDAFSSMAKGVGNSAEQAAKKVKDMVAAEKAAKSTLGERIDNKAKSIENSFGEDRSLNKLLQGGLIGFAGDKLAAMTTKAVELQKALREGSIGAAGITQSLLEGLPIIGGFATASKNIRELLTGEQAEIDRINASIKLQNQYLDFQSGILEGQKKRWADIAEFNRSINQRRSLIGLEGDQRAGAERGIAADNRVNQIEKERKALEDAAKSREKKQLGELQLDEKIQATKLRLSSLSPTQTASSGTGGAGQTFINSEWEAANKELGELTTKRKQIVKATNDDILKINKESALKTFDERIVSVQEEYALQQKNFRQQQADQQKHNNEMTKHLKAYYDQQFAKKQEAYRKEAAADQARWDQENREAERRDAASRTLQSGRSDLLRDRLSLARNPAEQAAASKALVRDQITNAIREQGREAFNIMNDPAATEAQKRMASAMLGQQLSLVGRQFDAATQQNNPALSRLATGEESRFTTGVVAQAKDRSQVDEAAKKTAKNTEEANKLQKDLINEIKGGFAATQAAIGAGNLVAGVFED